MVASTKSDARYVSGLFSTRSGSSWARFQDRPARAEFSNINARLERAMARATVRLGEVWKPAKMGGGK